jgi:putative endonuclease
MKGGWVYMVASRYRGTIYTGVTSDLAKRAWQHKQKRGSKFAAKYDADRLVYAERHERIEDAIAREKAVKKWRREWKIELIEQDNPDWLDLFATLNA